VSVPAHSQTARGHLLIIATWWGLVTGLGEGLTWCFTHSWIWRDLWRAAMIFEPLLFLAIALLVAVLKRSFRLAPGESTRLNLLFAFLACFAWMRSLFPAAPLPLPFLGAVAGGSLLAGGLGALGGDRAWRAQKWTLLLLIGIACWAGIMFPLKQARHERRELGRLHAAAGDARNVLVIVVDTLRADHLSAYGYARPTSPNLARLAAGGVLFEDAISTSSWTLPVHATLLTGLLPHEHKVDQATSYFGWGYPTIGEELIARGYRTAAFSANTELFSRRRGLWRGFIHFEDAFENAASTFVQCFYGEKIEKLLYRLRLKRDLVGRLRASDINRHALRWIDSDRRPFFVVLNYMDVHDPYLPPEPYLHRYSSMKHPGGRASEHWEWFEHLSPAEIQGAVDAYDGAINYVDDQLAELMRQLESRGLDKDTLVVVTSDHGESFNEHGFMNHGNALYRELIHVPLIVWEPSRVPAARRVARPVSEADVPATILELVSSQGNFPGSSLAAEWRGDTAPARTPPVAELAQMDWNPKYPNFYGPMQSVSASQWHYIVGGNMGEELFHCCTVAPEMLNIAPTTEGKKIIEPFREQLTAAMKMDRAAGERQAKATEARPVQQR
jgi:arylsulfatase A-like enzyme